MAQRELIGVNADILKKVVYDNVYNTCGESENREYLTLKRQ